MIYLYTETRTLHKSSPLNVWYSEKIVSKFEEKISEFESETSNLRLKEIISLQFFLLRYGIVKGIGTYVPTPQFIENKRAVLNIHNRDDYCLLHCINAFVNRVPGTSHIQYPDIETLNLNLNNNLNKFAMIWILLW